MVSRGAMPAPARPPGSRLRKQEMDNDESVKSLRDRIRRLHPCNADRIVSHIVSLKTPAEIKQYQLAPDDQIQRLIVEAKSSSSNVPSTQQFPPPPPSGGNYLSLPHWQPQFYPSGYCHGIQASVPPICPTAYFQSPFPWFTGLGEHMQSLSIVPGDGLQSYYGNCGENVTGYPHSISNVQNNHCHFYFSMGYCQKGESCPFSHGSGSPEMNHLRQLNALESLPKLEKEVSELLVSLQPPRVPIESLANIYSKRYGKPLKIGGFCLEDPEHDYDLKGLLPMLCTTRVIEREGKCYVVPVGDAPKYLDDDFKLVMPTAGAGSAGRRNLIYITFGSKSTFTNEDAWKYFSQYGPVSGVRIPLREKRTFGYVTFLYPETVKRVLSERSPTNPHFIRGDKVYAKACKEKHELEKLAERDAHSDSSAHKASDANVISGHNAAMTWDFQEPLMTFSRDRRRLCGCCEQDKAVGSILSEDLSASPIGDLKLYLSIVITSDAAHYYVVDGMLTHQAYL
ncbi:hypothetical protein U9M48_015711 [Paspalum notatum var. saurae]|uniref:Uncharacterized protein n=1 Tax=Paspalum notatum var. saurae TaxID=547442 RepID=A0AAQ3T5D1_PASNO